MASGDSLLLFTPLNNEPPATAYMTLDVRADHPVLDADPDIDESCVFSGVIPAHYAGGGLTVRVGYSMSSATTGAIKINVDFERIGDQQQDIDTASFAAPQTSTATVPATSGFVDVLSLLFTSGAQMDSIVAGEFFRIRVTRDANDGADTAAGDLEINFVEIRET